MKKSELRVAVQEMDTYQFGLKNELHNKLSKVTSYVPKQEVLKLVDKLEILSEEPKQEKVVVPQFVAEQLEYWKRNGMNVLYQFYLREIPSQIIQWLEEDKRNYNKLLDAIKYGHEVEEEKTYRFELNAFHEIDVIASSYDEAQEKADKEWQDRFGNLGSFGEVSFREEVEEV